jgi:toxin ParE1/3/4
MAEFKLAPLAKTDLEDIWLFISESNENAAERLIRNLIEKFDLLASNQNIGVRRDDLLVGLRMFPHKSYNIYYLSTDEGLEIYRILHSGRDAETAFNEISE